MGKVRVNSEPPPSIDSIAPSVLMFRSILSRLWDGLSRQSRALGEGPLGGVGNLVNRPGTVVAIVRIDLQIQRKCAA